MQNKTRKITGITLATAIIAFCFNFLSVADSTDDAKAEFIVRMLGQTVWPQSKALTSQKEILICIVGDSTLAPNIRRQAGLLYSNLKISVEMKNADDDLANCHLVYIATDSLSHLAQVLKKVKDLPIVTVGQTAGFGRHGVMVNIREINGDELVYSVNNMAARVVGLKFKPGFIDKAVKKYG